MTEAEALDMAAKAAGWDDWASADEWCLTADLVSIRAHAKTLMENAALKAENKRLREALDRIEGEPIPFNANPIVIITAMKETARAALKEIEGD